MRETTGRGRSRPPPACRSRPGRAAPLMCAGVDDVRAAAAGGSRRRGPGRDRGAGRARARRGGVRPCARRTPHRPRDLGGQGAGGAGSRRRRGDRVHRRHGGGGGGSDARLRARHGLGQARPLALPAHRRSRRRAVHARCPGPLRARGDGPARSDDDAVGGCGNGPRPGDGGVLRRTRHRPGPPVRRDQHRPRRLGTNDVRYRSLRDVAGERVRA